MSDHDDSDSSGSNPEEERLLTREADEAPVPVAPAPVAQAKEPPSPPVSATPPPAALQPESACVIDGSKLILRICAAGKPFQVDHGVRILFASGPLKRIERTLLFSTYLVEHANTTIVIDSGGGGFRFVPLLPALSDGVIYTRDGSFHVVLSGSGVLQRSRVSAPSLPTRVVNKFVSQSHYKLPPHAGLSDTVASAQPNEVLFPWSNLGAECGEGGVVFVRTDESVFEYQLARSGGNSEIHDGRAIAWTGDVHFAHSSGWLCFKKLNQIAGSGRIWIDNGKPGNNPNVVIT